MSLFVLASKDGWVDIMYDGLDAVGVDQQVRALAELWEMTCQRSRILGLNLQSPLASTVKWDYGARIKRGV